MTCWIIARGRAGKPKLKEWRPGEDWDIGYQYLGESVFVREPTAATNFASRATAERLLQMLVELEMGEEPEYRHDYFLLPRTGDVWTRRFVEEEIDEEEVLAVVAHIDEYHRWFAMEWKDDTFEPATEQEGYPTAAAAKRAIDEYYESLPYMKAAGKWTTRQRTGWFQCRRGRETDWFFDQLQDIYENSDPVNPG